jgi:peptidoglycan hydrolase-like protein with peptidoglycan-binding domain
VAFIELQFGNRWCSDKQHLVRAGPRKIMFLASKIGWAAVVSALLVTGMLIQDFALSAAGSDSSKEGVAAFVVKNEITKMQETLRDKGHYRGKVDGVFGLRTRASIRAYQKAENLPITGQVDTRTADALGVRPESTWGNSMRTGEVGRGSGTAGGEIKSDKPSAGIRRAEGRASKTSRKEVSRATAITTNRGDGTNKQQAENEKPNQ